MDNRAATANRMAARGLPMPADARILRLLEGFRAIAAANSCHI
jgi:hypothetical protein